MTYDLPKGWGDLTLPGFSAMETITPKYSTGTTGTGTGTGTGASSGLSSVQTAGLIGTAISALGNAWVGYSQAKRMNDWYDSMERIAEINQQRAQLQANAALHASNQNIARITGQYGALKSKQRVGMAANGVALGFGSSKEILATTDLYKQMDANTAYANGLNAALGYMSKATAQYQAGVAAQASKGDASFVGTIGALGAIEKTLGYYIDKSYDGFGPGTDTQATTAKE